MELIDRPQYMDWLERWKDKDVIKVVSGVRRCGKSTALGMFRERLLQNGIDARCIQAMNFENVENEPLTQHRALYDFVKERLVEGQMNYVFLDEIQHVSQFERVIDSLHILGNCDVYVTGSNAYLMSSELATLLSGRYVELRMLPLSFGEFSQGIARMHPEHTIEQRYEQYARNGSFPYTVALSEAEKNVREYLRDVYNSILLKDVVERLKIADATTLENIAKFLAGSVGNLISTRKIANTIRSTGKGVDQKTVDKYLRGLTDSLLFYEVPRWDVKGKEVLARLSKFYLVDMGLRANLVKSSSEDIGHILENLVYLELVRRGYDVFVGQLGDKEIDFVAVNGNDVRYYQVAASTLDPATMERELDPLRRIPDSYPKFLITLDTLFKTDYIEGIRKINAIDWMLDEAEEHRELN